MTACSEKLQFAAYVTESAWAENSTDMTSAQRIPTTALFNLDGIRQSILMSERTVQYRNEVPVGITGPWDNAEFTIKFELTGHGSTTASGITVGAVENLLGWGMGCTAVRTSNSGDTIGGVSTATNLSTTAANGFSVNGEGGLFRVGVKNDGRADGQWSVVDAHSSNALTTKVALPATVATSALPDVVYSAVNMFTVESTCAVTSQRFILKTADLQVVAHGCFVKACSLTGYNTGEVGQCELTIGVSWAEPVSTTFPDTAATAAWTFNPAPNAAGYWNLQDYGTTTRNVVQVRSATINYTRGIVPLPGQGVNVYQKWVGASQTPDQIRVSLVVDAAGASATPTWYTKARAQTPQHLLCPLSVSDGSAVCIYFPRLVWAEQVPMQTAVDGLNRVTLQFAASADTTGGSELERSAMRIAFA